VEEVKRRITTIIEEDNEHNTIIQSYDELTNRAIATLIRSQQSRAPTGGRVCREIH
jgi:hypothetical protein